MDLSSGLALAHDFLVYFDICYQIVHQTYVFFTGAILMISLFYLLTSPENLIQKLSNLSSRLHVTCSQN